MKPKDIDLKQIKQIAHKWVEMQNRNKFKFYHVYVERIESWLADIYNFSKGKTWVPTCKISYSVVRPDLNYLPRKDERVISVTFSNKLLWIFLRELDKVYKPYEVLLKFGFRGFSAGGRNGVFYQRKQDKNLIITTEKLLEEKEHQKAIFFELGLLPEEFDKLKKVKIVWHDPKGTRIVGVFNEEKWQFILWILQSIDIETLTCQTIDDK